MEKVFSRSSRNQRMYAAVFYTPSFSDSINSFSVSTEKINTFVLRTILLSGIFVWGAKVCFQNFFIFFAIPLPRFPKAVHCFLRLAGIEIADNLTKFVQFFGGFNMPQQP